MKIIKTNFILTLYTNDFSKLIILFFKIKHKFAFFVFFNNIINQRSFFHTYNFLIQTII